MSHPDETGKSHLTDHDQKVVELGCIPEESDVRGWHEQQLPQYNWLGPPDEKPIFNFAWLEKTPRPVMCYRNTASVASDHRNHGGFGLDH
ncbi:MAG: hypothetical protein K9M97_04400 [Akkermansiaceae bacterium]|nr:hypothetical protein [Akkermansiaceae bacterium]